MGQKSRQALLHTPEGVWDHYGSDLREYEAVEAGILACMHRYGYEDIKTPTFEFFDVFSKDIGTRPSRELYKFFDREGNTLVLRPDFTPSVARCAAKYFMDETKPLRFCYEGSSFCNLSSLQGRLNETTQMGAELVGDPSAEADAEMLALTVETLISTGLTRFQVTVGNVEYFRGVCEAAGLDEETELALREHISGKNYYAAEKLLEQAGVAPEYIARFLQITSPAGDDTELVAMRDDAPNARAAGALSRLIGVHQALKVYGYEQYISYDLSLLSNYRYYTGILFKAYTYGVGDRIAGGGRYDALLSRFGKDAPAIGYAVQIDTLMEALRAQGISIVAEDAPEVLTWSAQEGDYESKLRLAQNLRAKGRCVVLKKA